MSRMLALACALAAFVLAAGSASAQLKYYHVGDSASSPPRRSAQEQTARRAYERTHHGRVAYRSGPRRSAFPFVVSGCSRHNWAVRF
jgi:outer membrane biogenesis lipoprotein LolB